MGLFDKLRKLAETGREAYGRATPDPNTALMGEARQWGVTQLAGTTTICKDAVLRLATRHGIASGGCLETVGQLQREPWNERSPEAVAVYVEGERIGYLPGGIAGKANAPAPVAVQLFTALTPRGLRGEAWYWIGDTAPQWEYSSDHRPPLTPAEKAAARQEDTRAMVREAREEGGERAAQFERGTVNGIHYLEAVEPIKQLKREGRLEEALRLCYTAIEGAERDAAHYGREPAPWYTEQAAIVLRKLKRPDEEEEVLRRWIGHCPPGYVEANPDSTVVVRLRKLLDRRKAA